MKDRNEFTRDGEPLVDRGIIENDPNAEPPVDETDNGPRPVVIRNDDGELRNAPDEEG